MTDIVERLRMPTAYGDDQRKEAADEIERLRADIDKLMSERDGWLQEIEELRRALEPKP